MEIVADSDLAAEYEETEQKMGGVQRGAQDKRQFTADELSQEEPDALDPNKDREDDGAEH